MGCLFALLAGFAPRIALILVWIFTNLVDRAFTGFLVPLLGLIFLPYATLFYVLSWSPVGGVSTAPRKAVLMSCSSSAGGTARSSASRRLAFSSVLP